MADEKSNHDSTADEPSQPTEIAQAHEGADAVQSQPTEPPKRRASGVAAVLAVVALLLAGGAGGGIYYLWQQLQQLQRDQAASSQQAQDATQASLSSQSQVAALKSEVDSRVAAVGQQQTALQQNQQQLETALDQVRELAGREQNQWVAAEAEYLLLIANQRLHLQRDVNTAIAALTSADARLRDMADPSLLDVRERIAREIANLKAVPQPDYSGLALSLSGLEQQVPKLAVRSAKARIADVSADGSMQPAQTWRQAASMMWQELKSLVVIRHRGQQVAPLISAEEERLIRDVLALRLEEARAALLQQNPALFESSLTSAGDWLQTRFDTSDPAVAST
ncbi:MAG TPA: uroporphyrinogen-III C-methyltransferase, partial [Mycobacterium sp.]|nr:uroporphyrinogen-III C-methyltransferase [Mycobacterium sp.]